MTDRPDRLKDPRRFLVWLDQRADRLERVTARLAQAIKEMP